MAESTRPRRPRRVPGRPPDPEPAQVRPPEPLDLASRVNVLAEALRTATGRAHAAGRRSRVRRGDEPAHNPFMPASPPPGVIPAGAPTMAMDDATTCATWGWGQLQNSYYASAYVEGQEWLGYSMLVLLAQRAEYRVITETYASEMTREWIEFSSTAKKDKNKDPANAPDKPGATQPQMPGIAQPQIPGAGMDRFINTQGSDPEAGGNEINGHAPDDPHLTPLLDRIERNEPRGRAAIEAETAEHKTDDKTDRIKELEEEIDRLKLKDATRRAAEHDGFQGRGQIYIDTGDGNDERELKTSIGNGRDEISKAKIDRGKIKRLVPIEPMWCYPSQYESADPLHPDWYRPVQWWVMGKEVHRTRLITWVTREVGDMLKPAYSFGGLSLTQMAKPYVDNWLRNRQSASDLLNGFSIFVLLTNMSAQNQPTGMGPGNTTTPEPGILANACGNLMVSRAELFNTLRENLGLMVLDKNTEDFRNVSASLAGVKDIVGQSQEHLCSVSQIPIVKLLGMQPSGLNADSEGVIRVFYDRIRATQEAVLRDPLTRIIDLIQISLWGEVDHDITFTFKDLWQLDEAGKSAIQKTKADTRAVDIQSGIIDEHDGRAAVLADPDSQYAELDLSEEPPQKQDPMGGMAGLFGGGGMGPEGPPGANPPGQESGGRGGVEGQEPGMKPNRRDIAPGIASAAAKFGGAASGGFKVA